MARKMTPPFEPIETNQRFAAVAGLLRTLEEGLRQVEVERDWLAAEHFLAKHPGDKRAVAARDRLAKQRPAAHQKAAGAAPSTDLPPAVLAALELLRGTRPARRIDRLTALAQLEDDIAVVRDGIFAQQAIVNAIRDELSGDLAVRLKAQHRELVLSQYRALQALAATTDAEREFRKSVSEGGYTWRADLLLTPTLRSALIAGSEADWNSEVSVTRRLLEELKVLT